MIVACYPKCGTTLTEQIVLPALNGGDAASLDPLSKNAKNYLGDEAVDWQSVAHMFETR